MEPHQSHPGHEPHQQHPSQSATTRSGSLAEVVDLPTEKARRRDDEDGSLVTEYGLLAVVAATVAGVIIQWASGGALVTLFNALIRQARALVGA
jgi:Flp pilus assembly pilin Flp